MILGESLDVLRLELIVVATDFGKPNARWKGSLIGRTYPPKMLSSS